MKFHYIRLPDEAETVRSQQQCALDANAGARLKTGQVGAVVRLRTCYSEFVVAPDALDEHERALSWTE
jgi:hypothetical protein